MTANVQDYLKLIYQEGGVNNRVSNKVIAGKLGVAPPSVTEMLTKLNKQGLIQYTPYKGSLLTARGIEECIPVVRGYRLWEVFLMRHLGYTGNDAHEDAHLLEHATPPRMLEALDRFLNYPEYCQHGSAIPRPDGTYSVLELIPMAEMKEGAAGIIRRVSEENALMDYLEGTGLAIGSRITLVKIDDYEGPYHIETKNGEIIISYKATSKIYVELE